MTFWEAIMGHSDKHKHDEHGECDDRDRREHRELQQLVEIVHELRIIVRDLHQLIGLLIKTKALTTVTDPSGDINMAQTTYTSQPGTSTLTFTTVDANGVDITSRCSYAVTSDGAAMSPGTPTGNTVSVSKTPGTANLTIKTSDSGGDTIPDVVLACTVATPPPPPTAAQTTVSDSDPTATIS